MTFRSGTGKKLRAEAQRRAHTFRVLAIAIAQKAQHVAIDAQVDVAEKKWKRKTASDRVGLMNEVEWVARSHATRGWAAEKQSGRTAAADAKRANRMRRYGQTPEETGRPWLFSGARAPAMNETDSRRKPEKDTLLLLTHLRVTCTDAKTTQKRNG
jgi:hypothetical protein